MGETDPLGLVRRTIGDDPATFEAIAAGNAARLFGGRLTQGREVAR